MTASDKDQVLELLEEIEPCYTMADLRLAVANLENALRLVIGAMPDDPLPEPIPATNPRKKRP